MAQQMEEPKQEAVKQVVEEAVSRKPLLELAQVLQASPPDIRDILAEVLLPRALEEETDFISPRDIKKLLILKTLLEDKRGDDLDKLAKLLEVMQRMQPQERLDAKTIVEAVREVLRGELSTLAQQSPPPPPATPPPQSPRDTIQQVMDTIKMLRELNDLVSPKPTSYGDILKTIVELKDVLKEFGFEVRPAASSLAQAAELKETIERIKEEAKKAAYEEAQVVNRAFEFLSKLVENIDKLAAFFRPATIKYAGQ